MPGLAKGFSLEWCEPVGGGFDRFAVALPLPFWALLVRPPPQAQTPTDTYWTITTVAGTGMGGRYNDRSGDGGPAVAAQLAGSSAVAVDGARNLYIPEHYECRIRRLDSTGTITTVAGDFMSDVVAVDGAGNVYIVYSGTVRKVDTAGINTTVTGIDGMSGGDGSGDGGPAIEAVLGIVFGLSRGWSKQPRHRRFWRLCSQSGSGWDHHHCCGPQ